MRNIILCGLSMSGKTTCGRILAERLKWNFIDTDSWIEESYISKTGKGFSCRQIFRSEGEEFFRSLEKERIASLKDISGHVISLGGGALCDSSNQTTVKEMGCLIYLKVISSLLWDRMKKNGIPSYLDSENPRPYFDKLVESRRKIYEEAADITIDVGQLEVEDVVNLMQVRLCTISQKI